MRLLSVIFTHYGEKMRLINKALGTIPNTRHCFLFFFLPWFSACSQGKIHTILWGVKKTNPLSLMSRSLEKKKEKDTFFQFVLELLPPQKKADVFGYTEL